MDAWSGRRLRLAIVFVNYGPYHLARARAVLRLPELDPYFVELASVEAKYPWRAEKGCLGERLLTLRDGTYEDSAPRALGKDLIGVLSGLRPHVVALAGYSEAPMRSAAKWARCFAAAVVMMGDSTEADHHRLPWRELAKRMWLRRYADAAFVAGQASRDYFAKLGIHPERISVGYDVVDNDFFVRRCGELRTVGHNAQLKAGLPERYFLYVGRFASEKNLPFLLRAYRRYRELRKDPWDLVMVGDGPQKSELLQLARTEGLEGVRWAGFKQFDELPAYYAFADCFILPSVLEPWGLVVNEAMAAGLPVLVSRRCGCVGDLVRTGENGYSFNPDNAGELTTLMVHMSEQSRAQRQAMGDSSRKLIARWSPEFWADSMAVAARTALDASRTKRTARPQ